MASETSLKFYKYSAHDSEGISSAKAEVGSIVYIVDTHELWVGGNPAQLVVKGANDVTYSNGTLTVTQYDSKGEATTQTLDFSDVASSSATLKVFKTTWGLMGSSVDEGTQKLDYSGTNYLTSATTLVGADKALDTQIKTINTKIEGMDATNIQSMTQTTDTNGDVTLTFKGTTEADGTIEQGTGTDTLVLKKVATTAKAEDLTNDVITDDASTTIYEAGNVQGTLQSMARDLKNAINDGVTSIQAGNGIEVATSGEGATTKTPKVSAKVNTAASYGAALSNDPTNGITITVTPGSVADNVDSVVTGGTVYTAINDAIDALDVDTAVQAVTVTSNNDKGGTTLTLTGTKETNGKIVAGNGTDTVVFDKVATNGTTTVSATDMFTTDNVTDGTGITVTTKSYAQDTHAQSTVGTGTATFTVGDGALKLKGFQNGTASAPTTVNATDIFSANNTANVEIEFGTEFGYDATNKKITLNTNQTASLSNKIATMNDIASLTGAMHFKGVANEAGDLPKTETVTDVQAGDTYIVGTVFDGYEVGDMIVYTANKSLDHQAIQSNLTIGVADGQVAKNYGDLSTGKVVYATANGVKTSAIDEANLVYATSNIGDGALVLGSGNGNKAVAASSNLTETTVATAQTRAASALQSITEGENTGYIDLTISEKTGDDGAKSQTISAALTESTVTYAKATELAGATLAGSNGLLTNDAITPIKEYVDDKVGTAVQSVTKGEDKTDTLIQVNTEVNNDDKFNPKVSVNTSVTYGVLGSDSTTVATDGVAKLSTATSLVKASIEALRGDATSDDAAVAKVQVKTEKGQVSDVIVTNLKADVTYTAASGETPANLTASSDTGAVTGADIDKIKSYVDAQKATVQNEGATIKVNDAQPTTLATVDNTAITAKVSLVWEAWS